MDIIRFESVLKPSGKEYERVCLWNRFIRTKTELILSFIPGILSICLFILGYQDFIVVAIYAVLICYPFFIFFQFKSEIAYHEKHRDSSETAPCLFTFMPNGILAEIKEHDIIEQYNWKDFTTIYDRLGYYMMFNKGKMIVMIKKDDIPEHLRTAAYDYINESIDHNTCVMK